MALGGVVESRIGMRYAQMNPNRVPFKGWAGLILGIGLLTYLSVALPMVPLLLLPAMLLGALAGWAVYWCRNR